MKKLILIILIASLITSCATSPRKRFLLGVGIGATGGATGGVLLSPNKESQPLNGLVFGLVGGLIGGIAALILQDDKEVPEAKPSSTETSSVTNSEKSYEINDPNLPDFLKNRFRKVEIEEAVEADTISEDGTLHEPHKVYRIKRPAELISKPVNKTGATQ